MVDCLEDGYVDELPPAEKAWMERFLREYYDADNRLLKAPTALHRDLLVVDKDADIPKRWRRWWGRQGEMWPEVVADALNRHCDREVARVKHLKRECFGLQNAAYRDIYSARGVVHLEDLGAESWLSGTEAPPARRTFTQAKEMEA